MSHPESDRVAMILDPAVQGVDRIAALHEFSQSDPEQALQLAIRVSEDQTESRECLMAFGRELARIASFHRWVTEFEMRNMSEPAFDSYCENL
ncbi:hypothetical protein ACIQVK_16980 [Streptomyces sp. NPDC090493]|uniref:hypothetical protein n=1 Tax=Streptomyces sp. NPDC090493 TaxID=3365964 RepID=UPI00382B099F